MIINKPENLHEHAVETPEPKLPEVKGWFRKEETYVPPYVNHIEKVRTVSFVPGLKVLGFFLLLAGGCFTVRPADGVRPAEIRPGAVSMAVVGLAILLWKREIRHDAIYQNNTHVES